MKYLWIFLWASSLFCRVVPLELKHCTTEEEIAFGLMNCRDLKENQGMTFSFKKPCFPSFWMFNCYIDLSVAFCDQNRVIQEIYNLKAFPEMMDPKRPVLNIQDIYPPDDPICKFFHAHAAAARYKTYFALEVPMGWFEKNQISVGDTLYFTPTSSHGYIQTKNHE